MKEYEVPIYWVKSGVVKVPAESLVDACTQVLEAAKKDPETYYSALPEGNIVFDSLEVDAEVAEVLNNEKLPPSCHGCDCCKDADNDGLEDDG